MYYFRCRVIIELCLLSFTDHKEMTVTNSLSVVIAIVILNFALDLIVQGRSDFF